MLLEILTAAAFAAAPPVYLIDTENWSVRHCNCVNLSHLLGDIGAEEEYCSDGWDWQLYPKGAIYQTFEEAHQALVDEKAAQILRLQNIQIDDSPVEQVYDESKD